MEIPFTPEQEAELSQIAAHIGKPAEQLVKEAALCILENNASFHAGVQRGIDAADRGEFIEEEEMDARID